MRRWFRRRPSENAKGLRRAGLVWPTLAAVALLIGLAGPANAEDGGWDPTLPPTISAGAPGDPVAIANQSLQATANATQTTLDLGKQFLGGLGLNLGGSNKITEDEIERYVGVSKEYNVFELQDAFAKKDRVKAIRIIQYFEGNPKAGPIQLILPSIYNFFSKAYMIFGQPARDEKGVAAAIGVDR